MIACEEYKTQVLVVREVAVKLKRLESEIEASLSGQRFDVPSAPGRDVQIWPIRDLPPKKGLSSPEGQARLLHDLASIELQAMELALRTLHDFPEAPLEFRIELASVIKEEGLHLDLCLKALEELKYPWGSFPTHLGLWYSTTDQDSLLDRLVIVHRYLEGSGLDASDTIIRRLSGCEAKAALSAIKRIRHDEMAHVQFGSRWYRYFCKAEGLDPDHDFRTRLLRAFARIPRRLEPIVPTTREQAGFSLAEISTLMDVRQMWLSEEKTIHQKA